MYIDNKARCEIKLRYNILIYNYLQHHIHLNAIFNKLMFFRMCLFFIEFREIE